MSSLVLLLAARQEAGLPAGLVAAYDMVEGADPHVLYDVSGGGHHRSLNGQVYTAEGLLFMGQAIGGGANLGTAWTIVMATDAVVDIIDTEGGAYCDLVADAGLVPRVYTDWEDSNACYGTYGYRLEYDHVLSAGERAQADAYVRSKLAARIAGYGEDAYQRTVPNSAFRAFLATQFGVTDLASLHAVTSLNLFLSFDWHDWRGIRQATSLAKLEPWNTHIRGTLAELRGLTTLTTFKAHSNGDRLAGDLTDLTGNTGMKDLDLGGLTAVTGTLGELAAMPLTKLTLAYTAITGDSVAVAGKAFKKFEINETVITGDLADVVNPSMDRLWLRGTIGFTGDIQLLKDVVMKFVFLSGSGITGDVTGVVETWDPAVSELSLADLGLTGTIAPGIAATNGNWVRLHLDGNAFTGAEIDAVVDACWGLRTVLPSNADLRFEGQTPVAVLTPTAVEKIEGTGAYEGDGLKQYVAGVTYDS